MNNKTKQKIGIFTSAFAVLAVSIYIGFNVGGQQAVADTNEIMVYKSPTCGCCKKWVKHLEDQGFNVTSKNMQNMNPIKKTIGVQRQYQSCHTAKIGKYFIEGHVPAKDIKRLLKEQPDIKGLSAPGMPMGSPGMEGPRKDRYDVIAIDENDRATVYSSY
jgi:hypothetical protein